MTIKDIARLCGVSVSTVSRVLNDRPGVAPPVRERVLRAVEEQGFIPNNSARSLVLPFSDNIGLVVRGVSNLFYADILQAAEQEIRAAGYTMVMQQIGSDDDEVKCGAVMEREKKLRGLIFLGGRSDYSAAELGALNVPFVCCTYGNEFGTLAEGSYSSVSIDDTKAAKDAVAALWERGHRRIVALVSDTADRSISELRYRGYAAALAERGVSVDAGLVACAGSFQMGDAYRAMGRLLEARQDFTAVFAISDAMAVAAMKALEEAGMAVPRDCSVIGIDGVEFSQYTCPTLTTLCQPKAEMGRESVRILLERIQGRGGHRLLRLPTYFREGASVRYL